MALTPLCVSAGDNPCSRPTAGSIVAPPPTLSSENGALNLAFDYFTTTDSANRTLFCFVTPAGLESPTLHIKPGETFEHRGEEPKPTGTPRFADRGRVERVSPLRRLDDDHHVTQCALPWYEYDARLPWRPGDPHDHQFRRDLQLQSAFPGGRAGILRQNAQTSLKGAFAIVTAQTEPFPLGLLDFRITSLAMPLSVQIK